MFWEAFVLMTTLHRRLADSATVSAALPTAPPDGQVSRASKDRPLEASPTPTEVRLPTQATSRPSYQRPAW